MEIKYHKYYIRFNQNLAIYKLQYQRFLSLFIQYYSQQKTTPKMMKMMGARNTRGFSSCVSTGILPPDSHITYEGVFNELKFDVGPKTLKTLDCHFGYARYQFSQSLYDPKMNDYLCLFLKSERDGAERNDVPLNAMICLDISGSMSGALEKNSGKNRLQLSIEAIKMLISKLRPNDSIGMVVFDTKADVVFSPIFKKDFKQQFYDLLDKTTVRGGTTISSGLVKSKELLQNFIEKNQISGAQNRIIMLTDVGDNTIAGSFQFVDEASKDDNIHLTIVGISNQFRSQTCQVLKNVKGFNYFCAINDEDIKKHIFEEFNFNFLPTAHNIEIQLQSDNVKSFQTFGAPDSDQVNKYNQDFHGQTNKFIISKTKTVFPSDIEIKDGKMYTIGGVILVRLQKKQNSLMFKGKIKIKYQNINQQNKQENFNIQFNYPQNQQFYSEQSLREALEGYGFTAQIKNLLRKMKQIKKQDHQLYIKHLEYLQPIAPKSKKSDLDSIRKILKQKQFAK